MADIDESKTPTAQKAPRDRSPGYPFISLKAAIDRAVAFDDKFGRHPSPLDKAGLAWGYKGDSSQAAQTLSALKYFGLVQYSGTTEERVVSLTEAARTYMRAHQASTKVEILKASALRPKAMLTYWKRWGADRPINEICLDQLIIKDGFTEVAAKVFLRVYDETIAFAGLAASDKLDPAGGEGIQGGELPTIPPPPPPPPKVGDFVSWESGGTLMFESRRVLSLSSDGGFVFVEGSPTGLPVKEITVVTQALAPTQEQMQPPATPNMASPNIQRPTGMKQDTFTLDEGPVVLQWPATMSATSYEDFNDWIELQMRKIKRSIH